MSEQYAYGSRSLAKNDSGNDVRELQIKLVGLGSHGHPVTCTGTFDGATAFALANFCKLRGLPEKQEADSTIFAALDAWADSESEFLKVFRDTYPCTCASMHPDRKPRAIGFWNKYVKNTLPIASGGLAGDPSCSGFGNGLLKAHKFPKASATGGAPQLFEEKPGFNKILLWAVLGARAILKNQLGKTALGMSINNGYRCQLKYFDIILQKVDKDKLDTQPVGLGNHIGNAIDLNIVASGPAKTRKILRENYAYYETFDATPANHVRLEPLSGSPDWTHIDTTTFEKPPFVTSVEAALQPRYTAGQATTPTVPPKAAPQKAPEPTKPAAKQQQTAKPAASPASTPSTKDLLQYAEESKKWFESHWNSFFDAYRDAGTADANDGIHTDRGFFPVGQNLTWHGGIHAQAQADGSIHAMTDGVIVAARLSDKDPAKLSYGSRNFVLIKHATPKGKPFWSLYMHLRPLPLKPETPELGALLPWLVKQTLKQIGTEPSNFRGSASGDAPVLRMIEPGETLTVLDQKMVGTQKWIKAKANKDNLDGWIAMTSRFELKSDIDKLQDLKAGKVVKLDKPVKRNDCIGFVSPAKPGKSAFVHWEVFSEQVVSDQWIQVKDNDNDIVCDAEEFKKLLNKGEAITFFNGLTKEDIVAAYSDAKTSAAIRKRTFFFKSEWSVEWSTALDKRKEDFDVKELAPRLQLYNFWKDAEAASCDLPKGGKVWHYHPVDFINREFPVPKAVEPEEPAEPATDSSIETNWPKDTRNLDGQNKYNSWISEAAKKYSIDPLLLKSLIGQESSFNPKAHNNFGYAGLTQIGGAAIEEAGLNKGTTTKVGKTYHFDMENDERFDPKKSIFGGALIFSKKRKTIDKLIFSKYTTQLSQKEKEKFYIAAYNAGEGTVHKAFKASNSTSATWEDLTDGESTSYLWAAIPVSWGREGKYSEITRYVSEINKRRYQ